MGKKSFTPINQHILKNLLTYYPLTGLFYWNITRGGKALAGSKAGSPDSCGYIRIRINGTEYSAHRLAWMYIHGTFPSCEIDHINGICDDNRLENLRECNRNGNVHNQRISKANTSGIKGVSWNKANSKWHASIKINRKTVYLGQFINIEEAAQAVKSARCCLHKNFANHG